MNKFITTLITFVFISSLGCNNNDIEAPVAKKGVLDLRNWNFKQNGNVKLKGEWEFYWKKLISPEDFKKNKYTAEYLKVPAYWNSKTTQKNKLSGTGYATYRLTILHDTSKVLGISIGEQMTAYNFWCNNSQICSCGNVAETEELSNPSSIVPVIKTIKLSKDTTQFIFQISNFHHYKGGFYNEPIIGEKDAIYKSANKKFAFDTFLIGGILLMALYHLIVSLFIRGESATILLALFAISLSIMTTFTGSNFISLLLPNISWDLQYKIKYATIYAATAFLTAFMQRIYYRDISKKQTLWYIAIIFITSLTIFLPSKIYTCTYIAGTVITLTTVFYIYVLIKQVTKRKYGSKIFLISFFVYLLSVINDLFFVKMLFLWNIELIPIGTLLFILGQSLVYAGIAVKTFEQNKILSQKLKSKNKKISAINKNLKSQTDNLKTSEAKMRSLIKLLPEAIFEFDYKGQITFANDEFYRQLFLLPQNTLNIESLIAKNSHNNVSFMEFIKANIKHTKSIREVRINMLRSDDSSFPATISISRASEESEKDSFRGLFVDISQRVTDEEIIDHAFSEIKNKNKNILDSLHYAFKIQNAVMPTQELMKNTFKEFFIINKPHSIVSGDFYYLNKKNKHIIFALSDCTGHGVPGGFMTMLGITLLNEMYGGESIPEPNHTLNRMRHSIITGLHQKNDYFSNKDGMDIILCTLNLETLKLKFASANQNLYIMRKHELLSYKGDKMPVGIHIVMKNFTLHELQLQRNDTLYFFSDGIVDIFGGPKRKRLYPKGLKSIIKLYHEEPLTRQGLLIERKLKQWQGRNSQIDDMLMIGFKI